MKLAYELAALSGNTPLIPSYTYNEDYNISNFGLGKHTRLVKKIAKENNVQIKNLDSDQLFNKIKTKKNLKLTKSIKTLADSFNVDVETKSGRDRSPSAVLNDISKITSKNKKYSTTKGTKVRQPRNRFGWWDNTQQTYGSGCTGNMCASPNEVGSGLPYHGDWNPYSSIRGSSFGNRFSSEMGLPYDRFSYNLDVPYKQPNIPGIMSSIGGYPSSVSNVYPFVN